MKSVLAILSGLGVGAALMYLFDPQGGNRRRALIRDKTFSASRKTQQALTGKAHDLRNRAQGLLHESKAMFSSVAEEADQRSSF